MRGLALDLRWHNLPNNKNDQHVVRAYHIQGTVLSTLCEWANSQGAGENMIFENKH